MNKNENAPCEFVPFLEAHMNIRRNTIMRLLMSLKMELRGEICCTEAVINDSLENLAQEDINSSFLRLAPACGNLQISAHISQKIPSDPVDN